MGVRKVVKKTWFYLCIGTLCGAITLLIFEGLYRWQVIDMYRSELRSYNPEEVLQDTTGKPTILAMGDSFTAGHFSYPRYLQALLPDHRVINAGVSGTGVMQASLMAPRRFKVFKPSLFIYQIYVGNDLINVRYPINWKNNSLARNLYGLVVDRLRSVSFLNYRLGQLWYSWRRPAVAPDSVPEIVNAPFSPDSYSSIQRAYVRADASIWENQILVKEDRKEDFAIFLAELQELLAYCSEGTCRAYLVIVPHAAQVHHRYLEDMRQLGAHLGSFEALSATDYPFAKQVSAAFAGVPHIKVLNPLPMLQAHEQEGRAMYFANDGHLNLEGQAALAGYLKEHLALEQNTP